MLKRTLPALAALLSFACATSPMSSGAAAPPASSDRLQSRNYIALSAPSQIRSLDWSQSLYELNVKGILDGRGFVPLTNVEGHGSFCTEGKDILSFADLSVHKPGDIPAGPYLLGCATPGGFQPASREIVNLARKQ